MKAKVMVGLAPYGLAIVELPLEVLKTLNWRVGDIVEIDIPMTGGGLAIHKAHQHTGDEVI